MSPIRNFYHMIGWFPSTLPSSGRQRPPPSRRSCARWSAPPTTPERSSWPRRVVPRAAAAVPPPAIGQLLPARARRRPLPRRLRLAPAARLGRARARARACGPPPEEIRLLVCTHLHQDHAGLASLIGERTGCEMARAAGPKTAHDALRDRGLPLSCRRELVASEGVPAELLDPMCDAIVGGDGDHPRAHFDRELDASERHRVAVRDVAGRSATRPFPRSDRPVRATAPMAALR